VGGRRRCILNLIKYRISRIKSKTKKNKKKKTIKENRKKKKSQPKEQI
jgi:hypothetical protein